MPSACLRFSTRFLLCAMFSTTRVGGKLTCFSKSKKQREVSHEWDLSLLIRFHALVTAVVLSENKCKCGAELLSGNVWSGANGTACVER